MIRIFEEYSKPYYRVRITHGREGWWYKNAYGEEFDVIPDYSSTDKFTVVNDRMNSGGAIFKQDCKLIKSYI